MVIGLTGGIATGKSTATAFLREAGIPVIDADEVARAVVEPGQPALAELAAAFGPSILLPGGSLDRKRLGDMVFGDAAARQRLNAITHPYIHQAIGVQTEALAATGTQFIVLDVPLLFESGLDRDVDRVWVVAASAAQQLARLMERDALSEAEARRRIESQMPLADKIRRADAVIDNSGSREATRTRLRYLLEALPDKGGGEGS
ncbi:MAG: dephospho-CoA kinase [Symbiobacteriia bacterium]